jgi:hypothetical protein
VKKEHVEENKIGRASECPTNGWSPRTDHTRYDIKISLTKKRGRKRDQTKQETLGSFEVVRNTK